MKASLWIVIIIAVAFVAFLMGYSLPPFLEVGFGKGDEKIESGTKADEDLMKQYEKLYQEEETGFESE